MIKTVSVRGYDFEVDFTYNPPEKRTWDYPGCNESVEIDEVTDYDGDIIKEYAFDLLEYDLMSACLDAVHEDQDRVTDAQEEDADMLYRERKLSRFIPRRVLWNEQKSITKETIKTDR